MNDNPKKQLIVVGGPNGAEKTTLAKELLKENGYEYLSADEIAYEINPDNPLSVRLEAGKEFFRRLEQFANQEKNLLIESTLAEKSLLNIIDRFQEELGYTVSIFFIFLESKDICIERIQNRVQKGGHPVPKEDVIRRFGRSFVNYWNRYRKRCDQWIIYYNAENNFQEVAYKQEKELYVYDESLFVKLKEMIRDYETG